LCGSIDPGKLQALCLAGILHSASLLHMAVEAGSKNMQVLRLQLQAMVEAAVSSIVRLQVLPDSTAQDQPLTELFVAGRAAAKLQL
jgi:hypothetical protein